MGGLVCSFFVLLLYFPPYDVLAGFVYLIYTFGELFSLNSFRLPCPSFSLEVLKMQIEGFVMYDLGI